MPAGMDASGKNQMWILCRPARCPRMRADGSQQWSDGVDLVPQNSHNSITPTGKPSCMRMKSRLILGHFFRGPVLSGR
jgi:hypothetical protein